MVKEKEPEKIIHIHEDLTSMTNQKTKEEIEYFQCIVTYDILSTLKCGVSN
ncbi:hypothetical protein BMS3Abin17_01285 [archaeon BMS3Abin17]|nr:hypothetical protein BMS3Abin17_01285 [archaeon BMS3Abin17]